MVEDCEHTVSEPGVGATVTESELLLRCYKVVALTAGCGTTEIL